MKSILVLGLASVLLGSPVDASVPYVVGERARDLSGQDIAAITSAVGSVWLVEVGEPKLLNLQYLYAMAYLLPETASSDLRRGRAVSLYQRKSSTGPGSYEWQVVGQEMTWAQVPRPGHEFGKRLDRPRRLDHPFMVEGEVSDSDLIDLVRYVRTSPSKPDRGWSADGSYTGDGWHVDGNHPIGKITAKANRVYEVTTERRPGSGQVIEVSRENGTWHVVSVMYWDA